jgi:hypothetical protein
VESWFGIPPATTTRRSPGVHLSVPVGCQSVASSPAEDLVAKIIAFVAEDDPTAKLLR